MNDSNDRAGLGRSREYCVWTWDRRIQLLQQVWHDTEQLTGFWSVNKLSRRKDSKKCLLVSTMKTNKQDCSCHFNLSVLHCIPFLCLVILATADSSCHVPSDRILLDCGSSDSSSFNGQNWTAEFASNFLSSAYARTSKTSTDSNSLVPKIPYSTARFSHSPFTYSFPVNPGLKFIRLYFNSAPYSGLNPSKAYFSVVSGRFTLLHNFSTSAVADALKSPYFTKDFSLLIKDQVLNVTFIPSPVASNTFAFVNGIEILSLPPNMYLPAGNVSLPCLGQQTPFHIPDEIAFETIHRMNIGLPEENVLLDLDWLDDFSYLLGAESSMKIYSDVVINVKYNCSGYIAPSDIYTRARTMGRDNVTNMEYNLTWVFPIDPGFKYLVRLHLCEISSHVTRINQRVFKVYINNHTAEKSLDLIALTGAPYIATYKDYVVMVPERAESNRLRVALHPSIKSKPMYADAILSGIEIVKISDSRNNLAARAPINGDWTAKNKASFRVIIFGGVLGGIVGLLVPCLVALGVRRRRAKSTRSHCNKIHNMIGNIQITSSHSCRKFLLAEIRAATNNFDEALVVGAGGFGMVYKGLIDGGTKVVAVKRGNPKSRQGVREFTNEIELLSRFHHKHLVGLVGYCQEGSEMILVYEYMAGGTLSGHLYNSQNPPLEWKQRLRICIGAARGLHYLHTAGEYSIIHRDVKSTNILLDGELVAKVSDFGLSRVGPVSVSRGNVSTEVKGTFGYMDPEYYRIRKVSEKSDVYSFGVVLFEVLCGRPAVMPVEDEKLSLADWARHCHQNGATDQLVDPHLRGQIAPECLLVFVDVAVKCLAEKGIERPSMGGVLGSLEQALQLQEDADSNEFLVLPCD